VTSDYIDDTQLVLDPDFNTDNSSLYPWDNASGLVNNYDASMVSIQAPPSVNSFGHAFSAPALPQLQPSSSISTSNAGPIQPSGTNLLACPHGCQSTFGRPSEYRRHMTKHQGRAFNCTQPSCIKSFHRRDKLRDHLRQAHKITQAREAHAATANGLQNVAAPGGSGQM
jgi:uncharacterized C2H2 Zn-finger protein